MRCRAWVVGQDGVGKSAHRLGCGLAGQGLADQEVGQASFPERLSGLAAVAELRRALAAGGKAAVTGFTSVRRLLGVSLGGGKNIAMVQAHVTAKDLELLSALIEAGKVRPQIDRRYPFADIPYMEQGHARGKIVAEVA
jgi:NADPH:quinone reductase-like Zn-dependent oxidoreductase